MQLFDFIGKTLSDKGEPSSKRVAAFMVLIFTLIIEGVRGLDFETLVTFLSFSAVALGISEISKLKKKDGTN